MKFSSALLIGASSAIYTDEIQQLMNLESQLQQEKFQRVELQNLATFISSSHPEMNFVNDQPVGSSTSFNSNGVNFNPVSIGGGNLYVGGTIGGGTGGGSVSTQCVNGVCTKCVNGVCTTTKTGSGASFLKNTFASLAMAVALVVSTQ